MKALEAAFVALAFLVVWTAISLLPQGPMYPVLNPVLATQLPDPPKSGSKSNFHSSGYENARVLNIYKEKGLVQVWTVSSKITILFRPQKGIMEQFEEGWLAIVTFECVKKRGQYKFIFPIIVYISNDQAQIKEIKFSKELQQNDYLGFCRQ